MSIPAERARAIIAEFQAPQIENLFAQAHAKHVLHEVQEEPANFPAFDPTLDDKVTFAGYSLLAAGCSLIEQEDRDEGAGALEHGASILQYVHGPRAAVDRESSFHVFVAAMSFYAAGQYSRAFVTIRSVEERTPAARIIGAYLRKDMAALLERLDQVLLSDQPFPEEQAELDESAITVAVAQAVSLAVEFIFTGARDLLGLADDQLRDAGIVAAAGGHPAWWWAVRLLRLILQDLDGASPWHVLPPYFGPDSAATLGKYIKLLAFLKRPVAELWVSQRAALPLALNLTNNGAVINLRISIRRPGIRPASSCNETKSVLLGTTKSLTICSKGYWCAVVVSCGCTATPAFPRHEFDVIYAPTRNLSTPVQNARTGRFRLK